jgi:glutamyl-tRNA reductase
VQLVIMGLSHKTAHLDARESFAVAADDVPSLLRQLCESDHIAEAALLSTCNRVEVYAITESDVADAVETLRTSLLDDRELSRAGFESALYALDGRAAMHHLLRVASSLDSMVLGEPQILGQVKEAIQVAREAGTVAACLGRIFDGAFSAAKAVRTETEIGRSVVSIGSVAADLAGKIFDDLASCRVLLVGAGKMAEATARSLSSAGADRVYVANRSVDRAVALAQRYGWRARNFEELEELLVEADVVIMSTGARRPIVGIDLARRVVRARKYRPLFIVDIAVPRNVDPAVGDLDTLYVYNVDDLESASETNRESRRDAADQAEALVKERVGELVAWSRSLAVQPTLAAIRKRADSIARGEIEKTVARDLSHLDDPSRAALSKMAEALVAKILHPTMDALRNPNGRDNSGLLAAARLLHGVEDEPEGQSPTPEEGS